MSDTGRLQGKVAVITGGASGLGGATVDRFVREGAAVVVVDWDADAVKRVVDETPDQVSGHVADVASYTEMEAMADRVLRDHGRVDVVFANAGVEGSARRATCLRSSGSASSMST